MKRFFISTLCLTILSCSFIYAQILTPIKWKSNFKTISETEAVATFSATIDEGWHLYATDLPEDGPVPTTINWEKLNGVKLSGAFTPSRPPHEEVDMVFHLKLGWWEKNVTFTQKFKITNKGAAIAVSGNIGYMACNDGSCLPPQKEEFSFKVAPTSVVEEVVEDSVAEIAPVITKKIETSNDDLWKPVTQSENESKSTANDFGSLLYIFIGGFLGGLLALLTPCVWPMIPLTVSFFLKKSASRSRSIMEAFIYGVSIIIIYLILGLLITFIFGASSLNALSTNAVFNIIFFLLLVVFAISFFGAFDIKLPDSWANKMDSHAEKTTGILSIFFMAFTLTLVSFSCTGPIIGTLLVEAASLGNITGPAIGMFGFALALAIPFTLFAIFPSLLKEMPKSGGWLNSVKVVLGFIELALSLKFLSVADLAYGWGILDREIFVALWVATFALLGLYLIGKIRFPHDSELKTVGVPRFFLALISFSFAIYLIPGLWGAPLKGVSAFVPPLYTQDFNLYEGGKFTEFDDYEEGMKFANDADKPVLIDFSGFGCVNCRKMEAAVFDNNKVRDIIEQNYVMVKLMVDDKAALPAPVKVSENGKEITLSTIGERWSYLQRYKFGANSQPYYVVLNKKGELISGPHYYDEDIDKFVKFLDKGIDNFKK
ncbi:MAG: cytochrome c biogenesis protein CcdA [Muribaculaceae bacterium]|nr:cytochrome c biogenesis protein CcdA [Muribaculaceae bacterium]